MEKVIAKETLPQSRNVCKIVPAELGESLGDVAALCSGLRNKRRNMNGKANGTLSCS